MSIADTTVTEADNAAATAFFTVTLSSPSGRRVIANYSTRNGTASAGVDYTPQTEQVIFEIGETTKQIPIQVLGDTLNEADEAFFVDLISGENATFDRSTASCTILDNDPLPSVTVNNLVVTEGDDGSIPASFHLQLSAASGRSVQFFAATADGTAHAGEDYVAVSGLVTISPGSPDAFFQVHVTGTPGPEADEVLYLRLSSPVNTTLAVSEATLTIKELRFLSSRRDGADMVLTFPTGNIGQRYHLERRDSFAPSSAWTPLTAPEGILGTGDVFTFRDVGAIGRATGFYRILQTGP
jgi:hypothetical protein